MQTMLLAAGLGTVGLYVSATLAVAATTLRAAQAGATGRRAHGGAAEIDLRQRATG